MFLEVVTSNVKVFSLLSLRTLLLGRGVVFAYMAKSWPNWHAEVSPHKLSICLFVDDAAHVNQHHYQLYLQKQQNYFAQGGGGGGGIGARGEFYFPTASSSFLFQLLSSLFCFVLFFFIKKTNHLCLFPAMQDAIVLGVKTKLFSFCIE